MQCIVKRDAEEAAETPEERLERDAEILRKYWDLAQPDGAFCDIGIDTATLMKGAFSPFVQKVALEASLRERGDFTYLSQRYEDTQPEKQEVDVVAAWLKKVEATEGLLLGRLKTVGSKWCTAREPCPVGTEDVELDVLTLWWDDLWDILEPPEMEEVDQQMFRPLMLELEQKGLRDELWPSHLKVIEEVDGMSHSQVRLRRSADETQDDDTAQLLISHFGSIRRATREWKAISNKECALVGTLSRIR